MNDEEDVYEFLEHFGIKGMKWGVRNKTDSTKTARTPEQKKALAKKVAIGAGIAVIAAGAAFATYKIMGKNGSVPVGDISSTLKKSGKDFAKEQVKEPTDLIFFSKPSRDAGHEYTGLRIIKDGGIPHRVLDELDKAGHTYERVGMNEVSRYGDRLEKVAAVLRDPKNKVDSARRPIGHMIVVPEHMSEGIHSIDDIRQKIWPLLEPLYDELERTAP